MSIFNDIGEGFKEGAKIIGDKTKELSGNAKLAMEKSGLNDEVERYFRGLGRELYENGGDSTKIPDLQGKLNEINKKKARINEIENMMKA